MRGAARSVERPGVDLLVLGAVFALLAAMASVIGATPRAAAGAGADGAALTVLLVDTSASATRGRPGWKRWAVRSVGRAARDAQSRGDHLVLLTFDREVERRFGPAPAATFVQALQANQGWFDARDRASALGSDLAGAARAARDLIGRSSRPAEGAIVVFGDGTATGEDPSPVLLSAQCGLELVKVPPSASVDVALARAIAPAEVEPQAPVPVDLDLVLLGPDWSGAGPTLELEWELHTTSANALVRARNAGLIRRGTTTLEIPSSALKARADHGPRRFRARFLAPPSESGTAQLHVRVHFGERDPFPENDEAGVSWLIGDPVRVLVVCPGEVAGDAVAMFTSAAFEGIEFRAASVRELVTALRPDAPAGLPDAVLTVATPLGALPAPELERFVREHGGGWIHSAGWSILRTDGGSLAELAALELDREPDEPQDIVFFVDGSGSMRGKRWSRVRQAMRDLVPSVSLDDAISLRFFTQVMGEERLRFESHRGAATDGSGSGQDDVELRDAAMRALLETKIVGGATDVVGSLLSLAEVRKARFIAEENPLDGLVVLITDGLCDSVISLCSQARDALDESHDDLVAIHVGDDPSGLRFLERLMRDGEEVIQAGELEGLLGILQEAVHGIKPIERRRVVASKPPGAEVPPWLVETIRASRAAAELDRPLVCERALPCRPTEGATAVLDLDGSDVALVAAAARGRGLTAGIALPLVGDPLGLWSATLATRTDWLGPLLRASKRRRDAVPRRERPVMASAGWEPGSAAMGSAAEGTRWLVVRGVPAGLPSSLTGRVARPARVDALGLLTPGEPVAAFTFDVPPMGASPTTVRVAARPDILDGVPRGAALELTLEGPSGVLVGPLRFESDGAAEVAFPITGIAPTAALAPVTAFGLAERLPRLGPAASGPPHELGERSPHPLAPWLLGGSLLMVFLGALGARPGRWLRRRTGATGGERSPFGGQGMVGNRR